MNPPGNQPYCLDGTSQCQAVLIDTDGDGSDEILISSGGDFDIFKQGAAGVWTKVAKTSEPCGTRAEAIEKAMRAGDVHIAPSRPSQDVVIGGQRLRIDPESVCSTDEAHVESVVVTAQRKP